MKNTEKYFTAFTDYRRAFKELTAIYDADMKRLEPHRGSEYFRTEKKRIDGKFEQDRAALQAEARRNLEEAISDMERVWNARTATPTPEQLATVQMLNMRSSVTRDDLKRAANTCKGCPMAIETLRQIATKAGIMGGIGFLYTDDGTAPNFYYLRSTTDTAVSLKRPDDHRRLVNSREYHKFHVDFDPADPAACMHIMAGAADFTAFSGMVDGEGAGE